MIYFLVGFVVGLIIGKVIFGLKMKWGSSGDIMEADEDGDHYLFLELKEHPSSIMQKHHVIFKVNKKDIYSRK